MNCRYSATYFHGFSAVGPRFWYLAHLALVFVESPLGDPYLNSIIHSKFWFAFRLADARSGRMLYGRTSRSRTVADESPTNTKSSDDDYLD